MENNILVGTIVDLDVKKNGAVYIKMENNGQIIGPQSGNNKDISFKETPSINKSEIVYKTLKQSQNSSSMLKVTNKYVSLIGSPTSRFISTEKLGNFIVGPLSITATPQDIRISKVFKLNPFLISTMPSTIVTPMPLLVFDFPLANTVNTIKNLITEYTQFLTETLA